MYELLAWSLIFSAIFAMVDQIYKHADIIFRIACKTCITAFLCACLWAIVYIQNNAEEFAERLEKVRTQL